MRTERLASMSEYEPRRGTRESNESAIGTWFIRSKEGTT
jgi:hypothetical protein